jgi:cytochrome d ubiquinol oxidase subunit II
LPSPPSFSGFYLPLVPILLALIVRGVAFEFRSRDRHPAWRGLWNWMVFVGSLIPALLWGMAFANLVRGVPIEADMQYVGGFWNLRNPCALVGGLTTLSLFVLHGTVFLSLRARGEMAERVQAMAFPCWPTRLGATISFANAWGATKR